ncbi:hypothetical protein I4F81_009338 [Pyropia yezoensis]|uniref:Uncharacterized protein n=1 Tax=Pyropia yezoensis TaxID=2788 RepID=A0ACC3CAP3_PYRYE|nr:hypothetical protein I4F81_009338 [Neopyropia yezoensis]
MGPAQSPRRPTGRLPERPTSAAAGPGCPVSVRAPPRPRGTREGPTAPRPSGARRGRGRATGRARWTGPAARGRSPTGGAPPRQWPPPPPAPTCCGAGSWGTRRAHRQAPRPPPRPSWAGGPQTACPQAWATRAPTARPAAQRGMRRGWRRGGGRPTQDWAAATRPRGAPPPAGAAAAAATAGRPPPRWLAAHGRAQGGPPQQRRCRRRRRDRWPRRGWGQGRRPCGWRLRRRRPWQMAAEESHLHCTDTIGGWGGTEQSAARWATQEGQQGQWGGPARLQRNKAPSAGVGEVGRVEGSKRRARKHGRRRQCEHYQREPRGAGAACKRARSWERL